MPEIKQSMTVTTWTGPSCAQPVPLCPAGLSLPSKCSLRFFFWKAALFPLVHLSSLESSRFAPAKADAGQIPTAGSVSRLPLDCSW